MNTVNARWTEPLIPSLVPQVYYITCPEITKAFTHFPTTPTGSEVTSIEQATGKCVAHAREESTPSFLCTGDGQWSLLNGGCACLPGYQANTEKQTCDGEYPVVCMHPLFVPTCVSRCSVPPVCMCSLERLQVCRGPVLARPGGGVPCASVQRRAPLPPPTAVWCCVTRQIVIYLIEGRLRSADPYHGNCTICKASCPTQRPQL